MTPQPLEIFAATLPLGHAQDRRPWLVVEQTDPVRWRMLPISAATDLFDPALHFRLDPRHPDFPATGLRKASFIIANWPVDAAEAVLQKRIGRLEGRLADEFTRWLGR